MESPVDESERSRRQGVDALLGEKDRVAGRLGELLDAGGDVDGVTDQSELELVCTADSPSDHQTGVDAGADPKVAAESLFDVAVNQNSGAHRGVGMVREVVGGAEDGQSAVAEEFVDVP